MPMSKNTALSLLIVLGAFFGGSGVAAAAGAPATPAPAAVPASPPPASLTKADVEKIVHDYIMENPVVILTAVDEYQKKTQAGAQGAALEKNKDFLYGDADSPVMGNPAGDVTVVEFMDYNCHYCKVSLPTILSLLEKDKQVRVIFKDFPILGPTSETAAKWALAAQKQKKYFEFHKALMDNKSPISNEVLEKIAKNLGLDVAQAKKDAEGAEVSGQISKNRSLAMNLGLSGTPAFIIGDEVFAGAMPLEDMQKEIAELRQEKQKKQEKTKK